MNFSLKTCCARGVRGDLTIELEQAIFRMLPKNIRVNKSRLKIKRHNCANSVGTKLNLCK